MLMSNTARAARLHYMANGFRVLSPGDHVVCAVRRGDPARRPALLERRQTGTLCQRRDRHPGRHRGMIRAYWLGGVAALATLASCVGPPDNRPPAPIPAPVPQPVPSPTPAPLPPEIGRDHV